jgi:hypothetical protein
LASNTTSDLPDSGGYTGISVTTNVAAGLTPPAIAADITNFSVWENFGNTNDGAGLNLPRSSVCQPSCDFGYIVAFHSGGLPRPASEHAPIVNPEPSTWLLLLSGLLVLLLMRRHTGWQT